MAKLYFKVASDWEEVVRLRNEIARLKQELKNMDSTQSPTAFKTLNTQLAASTQRMDELVTEAAKAGAVIEGDFKRKIFDASQNVNGLSEKITFQRGAIQKLKNELSGLKEKYREVLKQDGNTSSLEAKIKSTSAKLRDQKDALFNLTQEQANARLSVKKLRDEYELYKNDGKQVVETNKNIGLSLGKALGIIGGVAALKQLGSEIIRVRGEFQSMQTAIETMVGKDMAGQLIPQIKELAKISPLTMSDMVGAEKMMLGFNIQAEDTIKYLKALSDISMGESGKFNSLTLAFSQMSAAGKLMGQDLNQMINAGFNPLQVIAEKSGKSIATLKDEMSKGAVSAKMVQQAFIDATSEGGKFFGMSENASKTINGQISMMQDAWDNALNEIGNKSEDFIMSGIKATTSLIQNYETVGKVLVGLIATYGTYKAGMLVVLAIEQARNKTLWTNIKATKAYMVAQAALNTVMKANPFVLVATAAVSLGMALWALRDSTNAVVKAQENYNKRKEKQINLEQKHKKDLEDLISTIQSEYTSSMDRVKAMDEIKKAYPTLFQKYIDEKGHIRDLIGLWKDYNEEVSKAKTEQNKSNYEEAKAKYERLLNDFNNKAYLLNTNQYTSEASARLAAKNRLDDAYNEMQLHQKDVRADEIIQWQIDLKNQTDKQIEAELNESKRILEARKNLPNFNLPITLGTLPGVASDAEIKKRISIIEAEQKSRQKEEGNYKKDFIKAKEEWEKAKKVLAAIEKDKDKFTTKQYEDAKKKKESTEKTYKDLGGLTGSALTKQESEAEKQKKKQQKLSDDLLSLRRKNQQDEINLMKEGTEKKIAQINLDYQKEIDSYRKLAKEWAEKQGGKLTTEQTIQISLAYSSAKKKKETGESNLYLSQIEEDRKYWQQYILEYGSYEEKRLLITRQYAEKIRQEQSDAKKTILREEEKEALKELDQTMIEKSDLWIKLFSKSSDMSKRGIREVLSEAQKLINYLSGISTEKPVGFTDEQLNSLQGDVEKIKALYDGINEKQEELDKRNNYPFSGIINGFRGLKKSAETYNKALGEVDKNKKKALLSQAELEKQKGLNYLKEGAIEAANGIVSLTEKMKELAELTGDSKFSQFADEMNSLASNLQAAGQGAQSGGWIGAVIGGATNMIEQTFSSILQAKASEEEYLQNHEDFINALKLQDLKLKDEDYESFGAKGLQKAIDAAQKAKEAMREYEEEVTKQTIPNIEKEFKSLGAAIFAPIFGSWGFGKRISNETKTVLEAYRKGYTDLQAMTIKTKDRSGWANFWGKKDKYMALKDLAPQLWDEKGEFNVDNAKLFLETNTQINDSQRKQIQNVIDLKEQYNDLIDIVDEQIDNTFGDIATSLTDAIWEGVLNGADVWDKFEDIGLNVIQTMGKELVNSLLIGSYLDKFKEKMRNAYLLDDQKDVQKEITNILTDIKKGLPSIINSSTDLTTEFLDYAKQMGWDVDKLKENKTQTATKKGVETITQDQAGELTGRITDVQGTTRDIKAQVVQQTETISILNLKADALLNTNSNIRNIADETRTILANSYLELRQISENTGAIVVPIREMNDKLEKIQRNTENL